MTWLRGRLYGNPDLPRRWTWLLIGAAILTVWVSWVGGRTW